MLYLNVVKKDFHITYGTGVRYKKKFVVNKNQNKKLMLDPTFLYLKKLRINLIKEHDLLRKHTKEI